MSLGEVLLEKIENDKLGGFREHRNLSSLTLSRFLVLYTLINAQIWLTITFLPYI